MNNNPTFDFDYPLPDNGPRPCVSIVDSLEGPALFLRQTELEVIADNIVAGMKEDHPELIAKKYIIMPRFRLTGKDWRFLIMKIKSNDGSILDSSGTHLFILKPGDWACQYLRVEFIFAPLFEPMTPLISSEEGAAEETTEGLAALAIEDSPDEYSEDEEPPTPASGVTDASSEWEDGADYALSQ